MLYCLISTAAYIFMENNIFKYWHFAFEKKSIATQLLFGLIHFLVGKPVWISTDLQGGQIHVCLTHSI